MKEITITVQFDDKWSYKSVNAELACKLCHLSEYYDFKIYTSVCKSWCESEEESEKRLNEGETFYDW